MNKADKCYINLLNDIMENGVEKKTRAGDVLSVFGRQLRFDLKKGFPLLTTKKVFMKGIAHELLWFLQRKSRECALVARPSGCIRSGIPRAQTPFFKCQRRTHPADDAAGDPGGVQNEGRS